MNTGKCLLSSIRAGRCPATIRTSTLFGPINNTRYRRSEDIDTGKYNYRELTNNYSMDQINASDSRRMPRAELPHLRKRLRSFHSLRLNN